MCSFNVTFVLMFPKFLDGKFALLFLKKWGGVVSAAYLEAGTSSIMYACLFDVNEGIFKMICLFYCSPPSSFHFNPSYDLNFQPTGSTFSLQIFGPPLWSRLDPPFPLRVHTTQLLWRGGVNGSKIISSQQMDTKGAFSVVQGEGR